MKPPLNGFSGYDEKSICAVSRSVMVATDVAEYEEAVTSPKGPKHRWMKVDAATDRITDRLGNAQIRLVQPPPLLLPLHHDQSTAQPARR